MSTSGWNTDMAAAPRGKAEAVIIASECRKVIKSYWLSKENRWAGFSEKSRPVAWQPWPEWPELDLMEYL